MEDKTLLLLQYLDNLTKLQQSGFVCHREIGNCIEEIEELLITKYDSPCADLDSDK